MIAQTVYENLIDILKENDKEVSQIKFKENLNDYTISFFDNAAIKIILGKKNYVSIKSIFITDIFPSTIKLEYKKSTPNYQRFEYDSFFDLSQLSPVILLIYEKTELLDEPFACCSRYLECSDNLKCVQPDRDLSNGCMYKKNLERGKIFYGKNRNK